jgi:hypothetical protein
MDSEALLSATVSWMKKTSAKLETELIWAIAYVNGLALLDPIGVRVALLLTFAAAWTPTTNFAVVQRLRPLDILGDILH